MDYKISVIIPGYNVAKYIRQCLDSIVNQSFKNIQVIMVDDGSPDIETGLIMDEYAAKYKNFEVVHQKNMGLGAARNTGVRYAKGEYIAFVDSDDYLSLDAYEKMYGMAERTHSDIIIGGVNRFNSKKNIKSWLHSKAIIDTAEKSHITKNPALLYDTTAWNKLYKKSFWDKHQLTFPEGMLYEDIPVTIPAHFLAESVDIVEDTVYYWRMRESDDGSITQNRSDINNFLDRLKALHMLDAFLRKNHVSDEIVKANQLKYLIVDYYIYLKDLKFADSVYIQQFQHLLSDELAKISPELFKQIPVLQALAYRFVMDNHMEDVLKLIKIGKKRNLNFKPYKKNGHWYKKFLVSDRTKATPVCIDNSLEAVSKIHSINWSEDSTLNITGHAFIEGLDSKRKAQVQMSARLVNTYNNKSVSLPVELSKNHSITRKWGVTKTKRINPLLRVYNYDWSFFTIKSNLAGAVSFLGKGRWTIILDITVQGVSRTVRIGHPLKKINKANYRILDNHAFDIKHNGSWLFSIDVSTPDVVINKADSKNGKLLLSGYTNCNLADVSLSRIDKKSKELISYQPDLKLQQNNQFVLEIPNDLLGQMDFNDNNWKLSYKISNLTTGNPIKSDLGNNKWTLTVSNREVWAETDFHGNLTLFASKFRHPLLTGLDFADDCLQLQLVIPEKMENKLKNEDQHRLVLQPQGNAPAINVDIPLDQKDGNYALEVPLKDENGYFKLYATGNWNAFLELTGISQDGKYQAIKVPIIYSEPLSVSPAQKYVFHKLNFSSAIGKHNSLSFRTTLSWGFPDKTSRRRKFAKWYLYPLMRLLPLKKNTVVFESFWGRSFNDNPKAVYDYMYKTYGNEYHYIWFLNNEYTPLSNGAKGVRKNSLSYYYYLSRGKYFVENANFPNFYVKRKGQIEMQTLHGTFMKTMGLDEKVTFNTKGKQNGLLKRAGRWDYLISPSPYMTDKSTKAYLFERKVVECGFPRNDILYQENNSQYINHIKAKLNLPADKKVLLYAPTFRSQNKFDLKLDLEQLQAKLSSKYVILLRLHYFVSSRLDIEDYKGFAYDVSSYPEIQDLYLISDMMITDYSSVMFDYAHLQRPMIFFAYDLDYYRNDLRGVYLDYEETVPGPIVSNTDELISSILELPGSKKYQEKYQQFYDKFCTYGRGDSAQKAAENLLNQNVVLQPGEPYWRNLWKKRTKSLYPALFRRVAKFPRKNIVLFESFFGQQYSDNPRAIYEYMKEHHPEYKLIWNVKKGYEEVFKRENVPYVIKYSYKGLWQWARAKYWVNNSRWPLWLPKPKGTYYIQTWHGTPLKTLGADIEHITMPGMTLENYHKQFTEEARKWDYCVAPNNYSSEIFKRAFEVQGTMINSGYPRNDILYQKNNPETIEKIKEKLNIPKNKKVILYAPTWRDNEYKKIDHYTFNLKLDLDLMKEKFSDDAVLLMRMHYLIAEQMDLTGYEDFAIDVSAYEDIRELYLVSDCLITDYSSVLFDYANLKRPMVFYAYDMDDYANEIRGFYFDFEKEAPGPIVKDMNHLIPAVEEALSYDGNDPYPEFYNRFCEWEDGHASERVVNNFLTSEKKSVQHVKNNNSLSI